MLLFLVTAPIVEFVDSYVYFHAQIKQREFLLAVTSQMLWDSIQVLTQCVSPTKNSEGPKPVSTDPSTTALPADLASTSTITRSGRIVISPVLQDLILETFWYFYFNDNDNENEFV